MTSSTVESRLARGSASRQDDLLQRTISATARCLDKLGLKHTHVDDIARSAGISRATLYRRFGNRERIVTALLLQEVRPLVDTSLRIMAGAASFPARVEDCMVHAIREIPRNRFLMAVFEGGASQANLELVRPVYRQLVGATLLPTFRAARLRGELREGIEDDELSEWLMRDVLMLLADASLGEAQLRRRIRQFLLPVMIPERELDVQPSRAVNEVEGSLAEQMARLEKMLGEMNDLVRCMRQALADRDADLPVRVGDKQ